MIAIINYGMGNVKSVANAFEALGEKTLITDDWKKLSESKAIVLPGVGAFSKGIENLEKLKFIDALNTEVISGKKPYLGICLGLQFLAEKSFEHGVHKGFDWIKGSIKKIEVTEKKFRIPHMGWNNIKITKKEGLFENLEDDPAFYFVHSYYLEPDKISSDVITSTCWHGATIPASVQKDNIYGVQFHPEKSQATGLMLLKNFIKIVNKDEKNG